MTTSNFFGLAPFSEHVTAPTSADIEYVDAERRLHPITDAASVTKVIHDLGNRWSHDVPAETKARIIKLANAKGLHAALPAAWCTKADCPDHATAESLREAKLMRVFSR